MEREDDAVDVARTEWQQAWPDLDVRPGEVLARVQRLARVIEDAQAHQLRRGPSRPVVNVGDLDVLRALRRVPDPHELTHGQLAQRMLVSAAGMTGRLSRLERDGWITRRRAPGDGRSTLVSLTEAGRADLDRYLRAHYEFEDTLLAPLDDDERETLAALLRRLVVHHDRPTGQASGARSL
jgi:DNA-binding MarR family transcriptional regulator